MNRDPCILASVGHHEGHYRGHARGHWAGHMSDALAGALGALPFALDYLWLGRAEDVVQGETLVQVSTATQGTQPTGYNPSVLSDALFQFGAMGDAWRAADAFRVTFTETMVGITIFRVRSAPLAATSNLAGKRDPVAPNLGHEHTVGADGRVTFTADSAGGQVTLQIADDHAAALLPQVVAYRVRPGFADLETLFASRTGALPAGSLDNAVEYAVGRQRVTTSPDLEIGFHAVAVDRAALPTVDLRDEVLWPIARALVMAQVFDDQGQVVLDDDGRVVYAHSYPYV